MTKIKVIGVGGSGGNAISRMKKSLPPTKDFLVRGKIEGVELIAINADVQDLKKAEADFKIQIGRKLTKGLGAGMNPKIGKLAAEEQKSEIYDALKDSDLVFITYGLGGGCGTGAGPVVAEIAKKAGALTIAVVTKPFSFEGTPRKKIAQRGLENLKDKVDSLLIIANDKLLKMVNEKISVSAAFSLCDDILKQAVQGISDLISLPGIVNLDFADLKTMMKNSGPAFLAVGKGRGENRIEEAVNSAFLSPLLENTPWQRGKSLLFNISGLDLTLSEIKKAADLIGQNLSAPVRVIFGATEDKNLEPGEIKILILITNL